MSQPSSSFAFKRVQAGYIFVTADCRGKGTVTLKLDDVPLETAVRLAAEVGGLRVVRMNNVLFITSDARADKLRTDAEMLVPASPGGAIGFSGGAAATGAGAAAATGAGASSRRCRSR